jgi:hypothetical protein
MPLVRAISRDVINNNGRFSSMVMGVVKSQPFQMNMKVDTATSTASVQTGSDNKDNRRVN